MPRRARAVLLGALAGAATIAEADTVACHLTYGGQTQIVEARPSASPYNEAPVAMGSYFLFRIVYRQEPADLAGIKLYAYADRDSGPVIIHQASHPSTAANRAKHGFTGLQYVYEPVRDGELQYWCELRVGAAT
ncbi:hypothetical protein [Dechloromonas sp. A34]|uniref:hypothetical protein n=1 Tax=Dechloromonas sp. A34 TaxID=447588 RepID=UPI00224969E7|nr:hypothetical protein [Dechloromonas sp. A34]